MLALAASLLALSLGAAGPAAARSCANANARPGTISEPALRKATLCLVNRERSRRGMRRLRQDGRLMRAARRHARDMIRHRYFAHTSRTGTSFLTRLLRTGYFRGARRWAAGENLAWGAGAHSTPRSIVRAWLRSPAHRRNMLTRKWREVGVGIVRGSPRGHEREAATYATEFAWRR